MQSTAREAPSHGRADVFLCSGGNPLEAANPWLVRALGA